MCGQTPDVLNDHIFFKSADQTNNKKPMRFCDGINVLNHLPTNCRTLLAFCLLFVFLFSLEIDGF